MLKKYDFQKINISELNADLFIKARTASDSQQFTLYKAFESLILNDYNSRYETIGNLQSEVINLNKYLSLYSTDNVNDDTLTAGIIDGDYNRWFISCLNLYISEVYLYKDFYVVFCCYDSLESENETYYIIDLLELLNTYN